MKSADFQWQQLTVKASMRSGETVLITIVSMNVEATDAIHALKFLEPVQGHLTGSRDKLQQLCKLFLVKGSDGSPEPLHLRGRSRVVVVFRVASPVVNVNIGKTRNQKLQFLLIEDRDQFCWDNFVETY